MAEATITDADEPRPAGRPRDARLDAAIVTATLDLLGERGYHGLSMAAVAARAGTTKAAVYRRWSSKADLVVEAAFRTGGDDVVADTGDLAADIRAMVGWSLAKFASPTGRAALAGLLGEPAAAPADDTARLEQLAVVWRRTGARLARAQAEGEVRADLDTDALIVQLAGPALLASLVYGPAADHEAWVERIAAVILDGIRTTPTPRPTRSNGPAATNSASGRTKTKAGKAGTAARTTARTS